MGLRGAGATLTLAAAGAALACNHAVADTWLLYPWWVLVPGLSVLAVSVGIRRNQPTQRLPWAVTLAGLVLVWAGWTMSAWIGSELWHVDPEGLVALVRDGLYFVAYPMLGLASILMVRARTGGRDRDNLIDALIVMVALSTTLGALLFGPATLETVVRDSDIVGLSIAPLMLAAVVTASVRLLMTDAVRVPAAWLLFASASLALLGNLWTAQLLRQGLPTQSTAIDGLWVVGFVAIGAAALHPSMRELTEPVPAQSLVQGMPFDRLALLGAALLAAPFAHLRMSGAASPETLQVVTGGALVAVLAVWRVARLLRERDNARHALADVAQRDATVAAVGQMALSDRSTWELLADVDLEISGSLPGAICTVVPSRLDATGTVQPTVETDAVHVVRAEVDDGVSTIAHVTAGFDVDRPELSGERAFLMAIASVLSAAVRRRANEARLRHDVMHDALTELPNRTFAINRLKDHLGRPQTDVTVIFLDLDGFKDVNDTLGHEAGDALLRDFGARLRESVRRDDIVARFAGDEFVVITTDTDRASLAGLVGRIRDAATVEVPSRAGPLRVTASIGVASARSGTLGGDALLRRADAAMYDAKRAGRGVSWADRPLVAPTEDEPARRVTEDAAGPAPGRPDLSQVFPGLVPAPRRTSRTPVS